MKRTFVAIVALLVSLPVQAQGVGETHLRRLLAVPIGALPPMGMLMPASRNHNYWVARAQAGMQQNNVLGNLTAVGGGIDLQWLGGSTVGLTSGYQTGDCDAAELCPSHVMFGARARFNVVTGGPTVAALVGDNSATTTLGAEFGYGYATNAVDGHNACAVDVGMPVSVSLFQRIRLLSFFTPGVAWDVRCPTGGTSGVAASAFLGAGIGIQQLFHHSFDLSFGAQRIFRRGSGMQMGISATYVFLK
ncbi:MAG TPA: hypothetical protein VEB19_09965 [Gemmatimonadaceae bacterium]|nr:hypothetical protein [Gemmatimonadaceae bacterium]